MPMSPRLAICRCSQVHLHVYLHVCEQGKCSPVNILATDLLSVNVFNQLLINMCQERLLTSMMFNRNASATKIAITVYVCYLGGTVNNSTATSTVTLITTQLQAILAADIIHNDLFAVTHGLIAEFV